MSNCELPEELLFEILCFLPVRTLTRFRSVCKSWLSLISEPRFIKSHHHRASTTQSLIINTVPQRGAENYTLLHLDDTTLTPTNQLSHFRKLDLVGSVNGLVCLETRNFGLRSINLVTILWNPATRQHWLINFPVKKWDRFTRSYVGFGYDSTTNDFRIIWIFSHWKVLSTLFIYSCNEESWEEIDFPCDMSYRKYDVVVSVSVKGNPYWMGYDYGKYRRDVASEICFTFDVQNKVFKYLYLPKSESDTRKCLADHKDSLAYMIMSPHFEPNRLVDVYVWDEMCGAWSQIYRVGPLQLELETVLHCFKSGEIVIVDCRGELLLYDPISKAVKDLGDCKTNLFFYAPISKAHKNLVKKPQAAETIENPSSVANYIYHAGAASYTESLYCIKKMTI